MKTILVLIDFSKKAESAAVYALKNISYWLINVTFVANSFKSRQLCQQIK
jgi:hypothetical protein